MATQKEVNREQIKIENAFRVIAPWVANLAGVKIKWNSSGSVSADMKEKILHIPRLGYIQDNDLMKARAWVYHECGHMKKTNPSWMDWAEKHKNVVKKNIFNALEDIWMESRMGDDFAGCRVAFDWANKYYAKKLSENEELQPLAEALYKVSFEVEGVAFYKQLSTQAQKYYDLIRDDFYEVRKSKSTNDNIELAEKIYEKLKEEQKKEKQEQEKQEQEKENGKDGEGEENEKDEDKNKEDDEEKSDEDKNEKDSKEKPDEESGEDDKENGTGGSEKSGDDEDDENKKGKSKKGKSNEEKEDDIDSEGELEDSDEIDEELEEEIESQLEDDMGEFEKKDDMLKEAFENVVEEMCTDYTFDGSKDKAYVPTPDSYQIERFKEEIKEIKGSTAVVAKTLQEKIFSLAKNKRMGEQSRGKLDMRVLSRVAQGLTQSPFYKIKKGKKVKAAISILVDESGSMNDCVVDVRRFVYVFGEAFDRLKMNFEIMGSSTRGWGSEYRLNDFSRTVPIDVFMYKNFKENFQFVKNRLSSISARYNYVDGECVDLAVYRLLQQKESRKILFVFNDGEPYTGQDVSQGFLIDRTKQSIERALSKGITVICFGLGTKTPKRIYGKKNFIYVGNVGKLDMKFFEKLSELLTTF